MSCYKIISHNNNKITTENKLILLTHLLQYVSDLIILMCEDVIKTHTHTHTYTNENKQITILKAEVIEGPLATLTHFTMNHQHLQAKLQDVGVSKSKKTSSLVHIITTITVIHNKYYAQ